jgi:GAF domain-containing protein
VSQNLRDTMNLENQLSELRAQLAACSKSLETIEQIASAGTPTEKPADLTAISEYLALSANSNDDEVLEKLLKCAMHVVGGGGAGLTLLDPASKKLVFRSAIGDGADGIIGYEVPLEGSQHGLAFATGEIQSSTPLNKDVEAKTNVQFRNVLVAPLFAENEPIGTISAVNKHDGEHFTAADMDAYALFADVAALTIRQRLRESNLQALAQGKEVTDPALPELALTDQDKQVLFIMGTVADISRQQPALLPVCQQILELIANRPR